MDYLLFAQALMLGFAIAAPLGPIAMICVQRTLLQGSRSGLAAGLGAATADAIYAATGAFGLTALTQALTSVAKPLALSGVIFLFWLGIKFLRPERDTATMQKPASGGILKSFVTTFLLTLANPMTVVAFVAVFAALGASLDLDTASAGAMVTGVLLGSAAWWMLLVAGISLMKPRINASAMQWISRLAGILLIGFAAWQLATLL